MIIRDVGWFQLLFTVRTTIFHAIWTRFFLITGFAAALTLLYFILKNIYEISPPTVDFLPVSLLGFAIALFLGFANNAAYDRWWEGRKLWGNLVNSSRSLSRQYITFLNIQGKERTEKVSVVLKECNYLIIAFVNSLRVSLRGGESYKSVLAPFVPIPELERLVTAKNVPNAILRFMGGRLSDFLKLDWVHPYHAQVIDVTLSELANLQGACERIKSTPLPIPYRALANRLVLIYCFFLPFSMENVVGIWLSPVVVALISYALLALVALIEEISDPFGTDVNDLPLSAISRIIEINVKENLGESDLPPFIKPDLNGLIQ